MNIIDLFLQNTGIFYTFVALIGLSIGSFLNVVIYRLPLMLENDWKSQCRELLEIKEQAEEVVTLSKPASTCPNCQHKIRAWENIPVISYLFLKGKCSQCQTPISIQYPLIELLTATLSLAVAIKFGVSWQTVFGLILTWSLIAMSVIDLHKLILPDNITLPILWIGLLISLFTIFTDPVSSIIGAAAGILLSLSLPVNAVIPLLGIEILPDVSVILNGEQVVGIDYKHLTSGEKYSLKSKLVVDASGFASVVRKKIDSPFVEQTIEKSDIALCYREILKLKMPLAEPEVARVF